MVGLRLLAVPLLLVASGLLWFAFADRGADDRLDFHAPPGVDAEAPEAPLLVGQPRPGSDDVEPAVPVDGSDATDVQRVIRLRLRDPEGRPPRLPRIDVVIKTRGREGVERHTLTPSADGTLEIPVDGAELERLELRYQSVTGARNDVLIHKWVAGDAPLAGLDAVEIRWALLPVRTVDSRGDPRPHQRVLFRSVKPRRDRYGWRGETSDADGRIELGPFPTDTILELRPGWRGLRPEDLTEDLLRWKRKAVDGTPYEIFVGDQPRLVLTFPRGAEDARVPVAVLDAESGEPAFPSTFLLPASGDWRAPALKERRPYEIVLGPTSSGQFVRRRIEEIGHYPLEVVLAPATRVEGQVVAPGGTVLREGEVRAEGRGFVVKAQLDEDGRFEFAGLPSESITYVAQARVTGREEETAQLTTSVEKTGATWIELTLGD